MGRNYIIGKDVAKNVQRNLIRGFGVPLVKSALYNVGTEPAGDIPDAFSKFGTPYFDTLILEAPNYNTYSYDSFLKKYTVQANILTGNFEINGKSAIKIDGCIMDISQTRNITQTQIAGRDGSVNEFINNDDYSITIRGYFDSGEPDTYPTKEVGYLSALLKAPISVKCHSNFLNIFEISELVFTNYNFFQQTGLRNIQYFELTAMSEIPFQIQAQQGAE